MITKLSGSGYASGPICSLCCSLDKQCHDRCKKSGNGLIKLTVPSARVPVPVPG
jgi:hypothetical protein